jgi:hypothetical protein
MLDTEPMAEVQRPRLFRDERVGSRLQQEAVALLSLDGSAQAGARFEEGQVECETTLVGELRRAPRGREPGDATSDDNEPYRLSLTRWASMAMNSG